MQCQTQMQTQVYAELEILYEEVKISMPNASIIADTEKELEVFQKNIEPEFEENRRAEIDVELEREYEINNAEEEKEIDAELERELEFEVKCKVYTRIHSIC